MTTQLWLWGAAGAAPVLAAAAGVAESRRHGHRRRSLDRPGWVPWRGLQVAAFFAAVTLAILGWKTG